MRRTKPEKREIKPDVRYENQLLQELINRIMKKGKKSVAMGIVYDAIDIVGERAKRDPVEVFEQAIKNTAPVLEVKPRRVGGATYQVPVEVRQDRRTSLAIRWILAAARARPGKTMAEKLAAELIDAANSTGAAIRKREETHRMAEANRAFAHYRW
ncbi:MAG: 30S ribosomal protein S7 [Anaerolineales bacterium]|jgi:small subunit ribosomal protein S7